jgi:hypothetical protein
LVSDHALRKEMGAQARRASEIYSIDRTNSIMIENYRKVIEAASGRKRGLGARLKRLLDKMRP